MIRNDIDLFNHYLNNILYNGKYILIEIILVFDIVLIVLGIIIFYLKNDTMKVIQF